MTQAKKRGPKNSANGIDTHHFQSRKLLPGIHQTDLSRERRSGAPRKKKRGHHRPQLSEQGQSYQNAERLLAAVTRKNVVSLQTKYKADE